MCFDVSIPIRLIWSTDGLLCLRSTTTSFWHIDAVGGRPHQQKQTHQIAITALGSAAPASGGFGPDRCGRVPSFAMAASSCGTSSTKTSTSANASHGPGDVLAGRTAVPIVCGLGAVDGGLRDGLSSSRAPLSIQPQAAITSATVGGNSLQTDT